MNFNSFHSSVFNDGRPVNSSVTSNLENNQVDNITSIIDSFENGSFYETCETTLGHCLGVNIKRELDNILLWLNSDFVPCALNDIKYYDKKEFKECFEKARLIKQKFSKIYKFLKKQGNHQKKYNIVCNTCEQVITTETNKWCNLQQHNHFEEALAGLFKAEDKQLCSEASSNYSYYNNTVRNLPLDMAETNIPSVLENGNTSTTTSDHSPSENSTSAESQKNELFPVKACLKNDMNCSNCGLLTSGANFKFNFQITYDSVIANMLYSPRGFVSEIKDIDRLGQPTLQFKGEQVFTCLLCCCDVPSYWSYEVIEQHICGNRHARKKSMPGVVKALFSYHEHWKQQEPKYQAHQTYFLPITVSEALCVLCGRNGTLVPYKLLEDHINWANHKDCFLRSYRLNGSKRLLNALLKLQAEVYFGKEADDDNLDDLEENAFAKEVNVATMLRGESCTEKKTESDITDDKIKIRRSLAGLALNDSNATEEKEMHTKSDNSSIKNKQQNHVIIKSVSNESGTELEDLLEHRLLPHLRFFAKINPTQVECQSCMTKMAKHPKVVGEHICSKDHQAKANLPPVVYQFYCEICNIILRQNQRWRDHWKMPKHVERCDRLGASRKNKLTEYECKTCKLVIFGDDLSVKRHLASSGRGKRFRKKEIILSAEVKNLFKSEQYIQDQSLLLVREANKVLLNQDPVQKCCRALEAALVDIYPKCKAFPFGSRVSGLGNEKSDLDVFVDVGNMYMGCQHQDARNQEKFVHAACRAFRKKRDEFSHVNPIPTARTPIVQVYHTLSRLDCDLSFRHGLSVENTKFLRLCIDLQPVAQPLILLLKQWVEYCKLQENITTYALSMMVIFHLQVGGYLMPVHELRQLDPENVFVIDGWGVVDFSNSIAKVRDRIVPYLGSVKEMLKEFFCYYNKFNYATDVICPLLGRPIKKILFLDKPKGEDLPLEMLAYVRKLTTNDAEYFRARSPFCVQDPFDLSHNLVKACTPTAIEKLKTCCDLTFKHLTTIR